MANPGLSVVVDDAAQNFKHARRTVDFVQYHEFALLGTQVGVGIFQPQSVGRALQVQIHRAAGPVFGKGAGQGGFAHLARPQQHHSRDFQQCLTESRFELSAYHY